MSLLRALLLGGILYACASGRGQTSIEGNNLLLNGGFDLGDTNWSTSAQGVYFYTASADGETDSILSIGWENSDSFSQNSSAAIEAATDYVLTVRALVGQSPVTGVNLSFQDVTTGGTSLMNQNFDFPNQTETWRVFSLYVHSNLLSGRIGDTIGVEGEIYESPSSQEGWVWVDWVQLAPAVPQFTVQPQSTTNTAGATASLSAAAIGAVTNSTSGPGSLQYQWYVAPATPVPGATNLTLFFSSLNATNSGTYYVVATGPYGAAQSSQASLVVLPAPSPGSPLSVNPSNVLVTNFLGWGTSLCWWANVIGGYSNRDTYCDLVFSQLGLNIVRYNIGGGENPAITNTSLATNASAWRAQMPGFEPTNGVWNWNADANQRYILRAAIARGANYVEAFNNSPPWWMTVSGSVTGAAQNQNNLQTNYETAFALYLANVVSNLTVLDGVHFDMVTPMNEPNEGWWVYGGSQEGCNMSTPQQIRVVNDLRSQLNTSHQTNLGVAACDDSYEADTVTSLDQYGSTLTNVNRFTTHTYSANNPTGLYNLALTNNKPLWVTEYGDGDATGMTMARRIYNDLTQMRPSAWTYWQVVDESGSGWGPLANPELASTNSGFSTNYTLTQKFYVLGQFTEFIRPGSEIVGVGDTNSLAAYTGSSNLVIVTVNNTTNSYYVTYGLSGFGGLPAQVAVYRTSPYEQLAQLAPLVVSNRQFTSYILANSVTTQVLSNAVPGLLSLTQDLSPLSTSLYAGLTDSFLVQASGTAPFYYSWLQNGTPITGATNAAYTFPVALGSNNYQCVITNAQGQVNSSVATVIGVTPPQDPYSVAVIADGAIAYWRLNETSGSTAYDYIGDFEGAYGASTTQGFPGPSAPYFAGFESTNLAVATDHTAAGSSGYVTVPALGLNTNALSLIAWVYPFGNITNYQGVVFSRASTYPKGINYTGLGTSRFNMVGYTWNEGNIDTYGWASGLLTPTGQWSFVGLTIAPNQAVMYVGSNGILTAATNAIGHDVEAFNGSLLLGADTATTDRTFLGALDEVAVFNHTLSAAQLNQLYGLATGGLVLTIKNQAGKVVMSWPFGALQQAGSLAGPWNHVSAASPYTNPPAGGQLFYRVAAPTP